MTEQEMQVELNRLQAENAALKAKQNRALSFKVADKGGLSVYGLSRFPVTLYKEQWVKLFGETERIKAFMAEHDTQLKAKPVKE